MGRLALLIGFLVVAGTAVAATTYRWVDDQGVTHYSDQPHAGAEKLQLAQPQTYSNAPAPSQSSGNRADAGNARSPAPANNRPADGAQHYESCSITQPAEDEVLFDPAMTVRGQVTPSLRAGDKVVLVFDTASMEAPSPGQLEFHIEPVERGTHSLSLQVRDATGKVVCQSQAVNFHLRQASELAPLNPNNPANHKH
jgi:hypothetical protein